MKVTIARGGLKQGNWNHRVIRHVSSRAPDEPYFLLHEVYYDVRGRVRGWTKEGVAPGGEDLAGIRWTLIRMQRALKQPVLVVRGKKLIEYETGRPARVRTTNSRPRGAVTLRQWPLSSRAR